MVNWQIRLGQVQPSRNRLAYSDNKKRFARIACSEEEGEVGIHSGEFGGTSTSDFWTRREAVLS